MSPWNAYRSRINAQGGDSRTSILLREQRFLNAQMPNSLSFHKTIINGETRSIAIINTDNLNIKTLCTLPGETLPHGGLVEWMNHYWLITELDANNEVYTRAKMQQCNYPLRWVMDGTVIERWAIVEDGTKYMSGEYGDNYYVITRGDTRIAVTVPKDEYTIRLGRKNRFLIDHFDSPTVLAYELSKPFKLGGTFGEDGILRFVLQECNTVDTDDFDLHIANYYDYFPREDGKRPSQEETAPPVEETPERKVWI